MSSKPTCSSSRRFPTSPRDTFTAVNLVVLSPLATVAGWILLIGRFRPAPALPTNQPRNPWVTSQRTGVLRGD